MIRLTSREQKALLLITLILAAGTLVQLLLPHKIKSSQYDYTLQDSLFRVLSADTLELKPEIPKQKTTILKKKKTDNRGKKKPVTKTRKTLKQKSVNVNSAGLKELQALPGIGPKTAQKIIDYREEHGPFNTLEELKNVKRIGPKTLQKIRPYIFIKTNSRSSN